MFHINLLDGANLHEFGHFIAIIPILKEELILDDWESSKMLSVSEINQLNTINYCVYDIDHFFWFFLYAWINSSEGLIIVHPNNTLYMSC